MILDIHEFDRIRIVGDRVLIRPRPEDEQTRSGLFLPPGIEEQEPAASGYVLKVGPGFPCPRIQMMNHGNRMNKNKFVIFLYRQKQVILQYIYESKQSPSILMIRIM